MFAERLKLLRKSKPNLTQQDMANILGVAKTTYASYEQENELLTQNYKIKLLITLMYR